MVVQAATIRELGRDDLDEWAALSNQVRSWPTSRDLMLFEDAMRPAGEPFLRLGAWTREDRLCGIAECVLSMDGEHFVDEAWGYVAVASQHRRRGLGSRLAAQVMQFCRGVGRKRLLVDVRDREVEASGPLLRHHGFSELEREQMSIQDPTTVDLARLEGLRQSLTAQGIHTGAFSEIDSTGNREALHRAVVETEADMPTLAHHSDLSLEDFLRQWFERPGSSTAGIFVAREGSRIVGLTYTGRRPDGEGEVLDTGVVRSHRRRGIARVLKMMATRYARDQGMARVHTDNNAVNAGMLSLNRELGFRPGPVVITFRATISPDR